MSTPFALARRFARLLPIVALLLPGWALAHGGQEGGLHHGFLAGLMHPFGGIDHLLTMLAVGLWASRAPRRAWIAPLAFVNLMLVGALIQLPAMLSLALEPMVAVSLVVFGLLLTSRVSWSAVAMGMIAGSFALFHGAAHAVELSGGAALAGMLCGTLLLHGLGLVVGRQVQRLNDIRAWPTVGGALASVGAVLFVTTWL